MCSPSQGKGDFSRWFRRMQSQQCLVPAVVGAWSDTRRKGDEGRTSPTLSQIFSESGIWAWPGLYLFLQPQAGRGSDSSPPTPGVPFSVQISLISLLSMGNL